MRAVALLCMCALTLRGADFSKETESICQSEVTRQNLPGLVVVVVEDNRVAFAKACGVASVETKEALTIDHLFRVGSTTKMMVGAAVATLSDPAGGSRLKLDEPIGRLLPDITPRLADLTAAQLLSHSAGLMDRTLMYGAHDDGALAANVRSLQPDVLFAKPGATYSYSNLGYAIAGRLIEAATDKPFADAMRDLVFAPLGMKRTTFRPTMAMTYPLAQGHLENAAKELSIARPAADHSGYWPAGSMFTSGRDFANMAIALLNEGRVEGGAQGLSAAAVRKLTSPVSDTPEGGKYGLGIGLDRSANGVEVWSHGGARLGYSTELMLVPSKKAGVILLANRSGASLPGVARRVLAGWTGLDLTPSKPTARPPAASVVAGTYQHYTAVAIVDRDANGQLTLRHEGKVSKLSPAGEGEGPCYRAEGTGGGQKVCFWKGRDFLYLGSRAYARAE